jgi:hypothetical protein
MSRRPIMFCENCGKKRIADEAFCESCGHPFPTIEHTESTISKEISESKIDGDDAEVRQEKLVLESMETSPFRGQKCNGCMNSHFGEIQPS